MRSHGCTGSRGGCSPTSAGPPIEAALEQRVASVDAPRGSSDPGDNVADAELLRLALERLSPLSREALMLVAWHGLSAARAARAAGCSRPAFAVRLHRARARLAAELAALGGAPAVEPETKSLEVI
jgi:DNA-directed RNA polymerase specialized sigma24 family protein